MKGSIFIIFSLFLTFLVSLSTQNAIGERENKRSKMADLIFKRNPEKNIYMQKRIDGVGLPGGTGVKPIVPGGIGGGTGVNPIVPGGVNPIGTRPIGINTGGINPVNPGFNIGAYPGPYQGNLPGGYQGNLPGGYQGNYPGGFNYYGDCYGVNAYYNPYCWYD